MVWRDVSKQGKEGQKGGKHEDSANEGYPSELCKQIFVYKEMI